MQQNEVASHLEDATDIQEGVFPNDDKTQRYGNLLFLLQSEPRHIAHLSRLVSMAEIDSLLQTVMFTIYGNQYESREEHLLLTMFQVRPVLMPSPVPLIADFSTPVRFDVSIRQHFRIFFPASSKHAGFADDDDIHEERPGAEFLENGACRSHQQAD